MYIVRWLGHNGNSLYGFMGLQSKMLEWVSGVEWMDGYPLDCYGAKKGYSRQKSRKYLRKRRLSLGFALH